MQLSYGVPVSVGWGKEGPAAGTGTLWDRRRRTGPSRRRGTGQPLTEPATRPDTLHFWQKMKNTNTGSRARTVMVMKLGQSVEN